MPRRLFRVLIMAAALALACAGPAAAGAADWAACQGSSAPADIDQLIDRCAGRAGCEAPASNLDQLIDQCAGRGGCIAEPAAPPPVSMSQLIAGCTVVMQSPGEPPLRRALAAYQRGLAYAIDGQTGPAIIDFTFALTLQPGFAEAAERLGEVYAARGDSERAIAEATQAIRLKPKLARAYADRARAEFRQGDAAHAIADLGQALALRPDDVADLNNRCWMRAASGRELDAALADCDRAVAIQPDAAALRDSRGFVHLKRREYAAALADYRAALAMNDAAVKASALYGGGLALIGVGDRDEGQKDIAAALAIAPAIARPYASAGLGP
ncbi:MAG TPA: hypothetical protein VKU90_02755 [Caulobacteraceae bacterium]|nr:hypothetical protein [Caulobacteraceae bacterium]